MCWAKLLSENECSKFFDKIIKINRVLEGQTNFCWYFRSKSSKNKNLLALKITRWEQQCCVWCKLSAVAWLWSPSQNFPYWKDVDLSKLEGFLARKWRQVALMDCLKISVEIMKFLCCSRPILWKYKFEFLGAKIIAAFFNSNFSQINSNLARLTSNLPRFTLNLARFIQIWPVRIHLFLENSFSSTVKFLVFLVSFFSKLQVFQVFWHLSDILQVFWHLSDFCSVKCLYWVSNQCLL